MIHSTVDNCHIFFLNVFADIEVNVVNPNIDV